MSYNIDNVQVLSSTLKISEKNAKKAWKLGPPEGILDINDLVFDDDGYTNLNQFDWCGAGSGNMYSDGTFEKFVAFTEGDADLILTWEGGDSHTGLRIRNGKMRECEVIMTLAPENDEK